MTAGFWDSDEEEGGVTLNTGDVKLNRAQPAAQQALSPKVAEAEKKILASISSISTANRELLEACKAGSPSKVSAAVAAGADPVSSSTVAGGGSGAAHTWGSSVCPPPHPTPHD